MSSSFDPPPVAGAGAFGEQGARRLVDSNGRARRPRLTVGLSYYSPYVSGLSEAARRLNEGLVRLGWDVHVVTTRFDDSLARHVVVGNVGLRRCRRLLTVGRAPLSPSFPLSVARDMRQSDVTMLHLPLPEAGLISMLGPRRRLVTLYQCDPAALRVRGEGVALAMLDASHRIAIRRSAVVMTSTVDYAMHSRLASDLLRRHVPLPPPCIVRPAGEPAFRETQGPHIGFLGRIAPEKGLDHLAAAFKRLEDPDARLLLAGDFDEVAGGSAIRAVNAAVAGDPRVRLLGFLPEEVIGDFYASLDAFVLPSIDSYEAFGIAQVEAAMAGVPVVASDLPGVRSVVRTLDIGELVPPGDVDALSKALMTVATGQLNRDAIRTRAVELYGEDNVVKRLEEILWSVVTNRCGAAL